MTTLDRRLNAYRDDMADSRLAGQVKAARFCDGRPASIVVPVADLHGRPDAGSGLDTQLLLGETVRVFDERDGWCWIQAERDNYVGYVEAAGLGDTPAATHRVAVPRSFVYPGPDMKLPRRAAISMGSEIRVAGSAETRGTQFCLLEDGSAVVASHLDPFDRFADDYVSVAETLIGTPYLWGGASAFGIDCSGLVQLSMRMAGRIVLRDTDMQAGSIGTPIDGSDLRRGDLVFWKGHVAIVTEPDSMIHASGAAMLVVKEGLSAAIARIGALYGPPTGYRRPSTADSPASATDGSGGSRSITG